MQLTATNWTYCELWHASKRVKRTNILPLASGSGRGKTNGLVEKTNGRRVLAYRRPRSIPLRFPRFLLPRSLPPPIIFISTHNARHIDQNGARACPGEGPADEFSYRRAGEFGRRADLPGGCTCFHSWLYLIRTCLSARRRNLPDGTAALRCVGMELNHPGVHPTLHPHALSRALTHSHALSRTLTCSFPACRLLSVRTSHRIAP